MSTLRVGLSTVWTKHTLNKFHGIVSSKPINSWIECDRAWNERDMTLWQIDGNSAAMHPKANTLTTCITAPPGLRREIQYCSGHQHRTYIYHKTLEHYIILPLYDGDEHVLPDCYDNISYHRIITIFSKGWQGPYSTLRKHISEKSWRTPSPRSQHASRLDRGTKHIVELDEWAECRDEVTVCNSNTQ